MNMTKDTDRSDSRAPANGNALAFCNSLLYEGANEVVAVRIPKGAISVTGEDGFKYLSFYRDVARGRVEYRLYGISDRSLEGIREKYVNVIIRRIIAQCFADGHQKTYVDLNAVPDLRITHRMEVYSHRNHCKRASIMNSMVTHAIPDTDGLIAFWKIKPDKA
ncbi:MAG: hypothetical protein JWL88_769 [Parcubacteria group bacterium]|nr:hypothetical protein [Parcubacteria group bacterium]